MKLRKNAKQKRGYYSNLAAVAKNVECDSETDTGSGASSPRKGVKTPIQTPKKETGRSTQKSPCKSMGKDSKDGVAGTSTPSGYRQEKSNAVMEDLLEMAKKLNNRDLMIIMTKLFRQILPEHTQEQNFVPSDFMSVLIDAINSLHNYNFDNIFYSLAKSVCFSKSDSVEIGKLFAMTLSEVIENVQNSTSDTETEVISLKETLDDHWTNTFIEVKPSAESEVTESADYVNLSMEKGGGDVSGKIEDTTPVKRKRGRPRKSEVLSVKKQVNISMNESINTSLSVVSENDEGSKDVKSEKMDQCDMEDGENNSAQTFGDQHNNDEVDDSLAETVPPSAKRRRLTVNKVPCHKCDQCGQLLEDRRSLRTHIKIVHDGAPGFPCPHCHRMFLARGHLNDHIAAIHTRRVRFRCTECREAFASRALYRNHLFIHKYGSDSCVCPECGKRFALPQKLYKHVDRMHKSADVLLPEFVFPSTKPGTVLPGSHKSSSVGGAWWETYHRRREAEKRRLQPSVKISRRCEVCASDFASVREKLRHVRSSHAEHRTQICHVCAKSFILPQELRRHIANVHETMSTTFHCPHCGDTFPRRYHFRQHLFLHLHGERSQKCPRCDYRADFPTSLRAHVRRRHPGAVSEEELPQVTLPPSVVQLPQKPDQGSETPRIKVEAEETSAQDSSGISERLQVSTALPEVRFPRVKPLRRVKRKGEKAGPPCCEYCGKVFASVGSMNQHVRTIHLGERRFSCDVCGKVFRSRGHLNDHMAAHTRTYRWQCPHCPERFVQRVTYKTHVFIHEHGERSCLCPVCGGSFDAPAHLIAHVRQVHKDQEVVLPKFEQISTVQGVTPDRSHVKVVQPVVRQQRTRPEDLECGICGKHFKLPCLARTHMETVHMGLKKFQCSECDRSFANKGHLNEHFRARHTTTPRFMCNACGDMFMHKQVFKRHVFKHENGEKTCVCPVCGTGYNDPSQLQNHAQKFHKGVNYVLPKFDMPTAETVNAYMISDPAALIAGGEYKKKKPGPPRLPNALRRMNKAERARAKAGRQQQAAAVVAEHDSEDLLLIHHPGSGEPDGIITMEMDQEFVVETTAKIEQLEEHEEVAFLETSAVDGGGSEVQTLNLSEDILRQLAGTAGENSVIYIQEIAGNNVMTHQVHYVQQDE